LRGRKLCRCPEASPGVVGAGREEAGRAAWSVIKQKKRIPFGIKQGGTAGTTLVPAAYSCMDESFDLFQGGKSQ